MAKFGSSLFLDRTSETILATLVQSIEQDLEDKIPGTYRQSSKGPWQDGNGFSLLETYKRHLQVPMPKMWRREVLK